MILKGRKLDLKMKMEIKKYLKVLTLLSFFALVSVAVVMPATANAQDETIPEDIEMVEALDAIANWLWTILLLVAVIFIVLAGYTFVTAGGNSDQVNKARDQVLWAVVGVAVALISRGVIDFVKGLLTNGG